MSPETSASDTTTATGGALAGTLSDALTGRRAWLVAGFALIVALAGLFTTPPIDRDEARFAQATAQMLETGDFVAIRFQAEERNKKPAGVHWLQAASAATFSSVEAREIWAYRLPSVLGAVLAALGTYYIGARLFGAGTGLLAGLLLASTPILAAEATFAKTDAMLLASVVGAAAAFASIAAAAKEGASPGRLAPLGFWSALGAGVLLKGPIIALALAPAVAVVIFRTRDIDWRRHLKPVAGCLLVLAMVTPWAFAVNAATDGRFFAEAVGRDLLGKVGAAQERHWGPPGYHLALVWPLFWPAVPLLAEAVRGAVRNRDDWRLMFLLAWAGPAWILFELTATKLPHYTLPLYPALALMAARYASEDSNVGKADGEAPPLMQRLGAVAYFLIGLVFALALALAASPRVNGAWSPAPLALAAAVGVVVAAAWIARLYYRGRNARAATRAAILSATLMWVALGGVLPTLQPLHLSTDLSRAVDAAGLHALRDEAPPTLIAGYSEPSAVFLLGTRTILTNGEGAADHIAANEATGRATGAIVVEAREAPAFRAAFEDAGRNFDLAEIGVVEGVNYSNGKNISLTIYAHR